MQSYIKVNSKYKSSIIVHFTMNKRVTLQLDTLTMLKKKSIVEF
jgi:hypothetical protein